MKRRDFLKGVRGLEYNKGGALLPPSYNTALPFVRGLAGHFDYTPVTFNPKKLGATSFAHQLAMPIVFLSPVTNYADRPENYLDHPPVEPPLDVLKSIPTVWDETVVRDPSAPAECAAFARLKADRWFVGVMNAREPRSVKLDLSFLGDADYKAVILSDPQGSKTGFARKEMKADGGDELEMDIEAGGLVGMFNPGVSD